MKQLLARFLKPSDTDGDVLTTVSGVTAWAAPQGGGGASVLDDLTDVDTTTTAPIDSQGMVFDAASGLWVPGDVVRSVVAGSGISVDSTDPANPVIAATSGGGGATAGIYRGTWSASIDVVKHTYDFAGGTFPPFTTTSNASIVSYLTVGTDITAPPTKMVKIGNGSNFTSYSMFLAKSDITGYTLNKVRFWMASDCSTAGSITFYKDGTASSATRSGHGPSSTSGQWAQFTQDVTNTSQMEWRYLTNYPSESPNVGYVAKIDMIETVSATYQVNDMVLYSGSLWGCRLAGTTTTPGAAGADWQQLTAAMP